jgi:putative spermidine/putrescine transport system substrate-binding protein
MRYPFWTAVLLGLVFSWPAQAVPILRVLAWPGYADSDLVKVFEKKYGVRVEVSYVSSDDVLRQKINANQGRDFDVFAANTAELQQYMDQNMLLPLRLANIPNTAQQLPRFREVHGIPGITRANAIYAVPYTYAETGLIFDRKQFKTPPSSLSVLWDPAYQGRILAFNDSKHNFSIASLLQGGNAFQIPHKNFPALVNQLVALRRNVLTFYTLPEESVALFMSRGVAVLWANYGRQQLKLLQEAHADVGYAIPREGALAWLDCWAITRGATNQTLAEQWINYMLEPQVSEALSVRQGLSNTLDAERSTQATDKIIWLEPVEDGPRRADLWNKLIAGNRPGQF